MSFESSLMSACLLNADLDFPGVVRVIPNKILSLHTTRSWDFLHVKQDIVTDVLSSALYNNYKKVFDKNYNHKVLLWLHNSLVCRYLARV
jgi:ABC-type maltose transport system permease subunit